ncbi:MAG: YjbQ family protein [Candidatus Lokiarchaeota archaeon]|nr:YjbQ family protein [Candidatus Lokiarchaeota archaeon]
MSESFPIKTKDHIQLKNISKEVQEILSKSNLKEGILTIYTRHTTSGIIINEDERGLLQDFINSMKKIVPKGAGYKHDHIDNNAHSHIQSSLISTSVTIPFSNGILDLGTWQSIFFFEFDGPRSRNILIKILGE